MAAAGDAMPLLQVGYDEIGILNLAALKRAIFKLEILTFAVYSISWTTFAGMSSTGPVLYCMSISYELSCPRTS